MPFISKDWRSPGEEWVRYEGGWELKKTISVKNQQSNEDLQSFDDQKSDTQVVRLVHISHFTYGIRKEFKKLKIYNRNIFFFNKDPKEKIVLKIPYCRLCKK